MATLYVVMRKEYQYNDEINYAEGDGGSPTKAFTDKKKAEREAMKLNAEEIRGGIEGYWYDIKDILEVDLDEFQRILKDVGGSYDEDESYVISLPKTMTYADAEKVLNAINLRWYTIASVEADV